MEAGTTVVECSNVHKRYEHDGVEVHALRGVNLQLNTGEFVSLSGPSGSGKSSTSRGVADRLGLRYLDTGAQFRAMTVWLLRHGVDVHDLAAVAARCHEPEIVSGTDPLAPTITVDGEDVSLAIRSARE